MASAATAPDQGAVVPVIEISVKRPRRCGSGWCATEGVSFGVTVCGFVRDRRFNVYSHGWRITGP